jgi:hypothetical protein
MSEKGRTSLIFFLAQLFILTASTTLAFQVSTELKVKVNRAVRQPIEPLTVINGQMQGRTVAGQFVRSKSTNFSLTITRAEVVGSQLELLGTFKTDPSSRSTQNIRAKIAGSMAMAANPWPHASDSDETPANISGCGVLFLSLDLSPQSRTAMSAARRLQVGVVLAPLDNNLGEDINKRICGIKGMLDGKSDARELTAAVADLNRILGQ